MFTNNRFVFYGKAPPTIKTEYDDGNGGDYRPRRTFATREEENYFLFQAPLQPSFIVSLLYSPLDICVLAEYKNNVGVLMQHSHTNHGFLPVSVVMQIALHRQSFHSKTVK